MEISIMKKIFYLASTILCFAFCGCEESSSNNVDYFFEVEIGGVINMAQGVTSGSLYGEHYYINRCIGTTSGATLSISDITSDTYVSGQNMNISIIFDNGQLGSNTGNLGSFPLDAGFYINDYLESLGVSPIFGFVENGPATFTEGQPFRNEISNINITDLGTAATPIPGTNPPEVSFGETVKASYEGILYFSNVNNYDYDIPVPIRIEFNAVRH